MKFVAGNRYYTRNGKLARVTQASSGIVEGYVGDKLYSWHPSGRRTMARLSPIDLTETVARTRVTSVRRIGPMASTPAPAAIAGFVAEFVSRTKWRYFSPVFSDRAGLDQFLSKWAATKQVIRITTVAEVPEGLT